MTATARPAPAPTGPDHVEPDHVGSDAVGDRFVDLPAGPRICFRTEGPADGVPVLLVAGLGLDLTSWPQRMVDGFVDRGFRVIRFDNRDAGRSSRGDAPPPGRLRQLLARPRPDAYDLGDMAADAYGLLDHLGIDRVHLVGMSMGGMIAQTLAARHPETVLSLTSIMSNTGSMLSGRPGFSVYQLFFQRPRQGREEAIKRTMKVFQLIGSRGLRRDDELIRDMAARSYDRDHDAAAPGRQLAAIIASGNRTKEVRRIKAPTLVIHGDRDKMVGPSGGRATARAIRGAKLMTVKGMGHDLPPGVWRQIIDGIVANAERAASPARAAA
jgi:pimeloyl-ACP methyl ester carboxylesterase